MLKLSGFLLWCIVFNEATAKDTFVVPMIDWIVRVEGTPTQNELTAMQLHSASQLAIDRVNNGTYPDLLPNRIIALDVREDKLSVAVSNPQINNSHKIEIVNSFLQKAVEEMIRFALSGVTLVVGFPISAVSVQTASVGTTFGVAQVSSIAAAVDLSNDVKYPYFTRLNVPNGEYAASTKASVVYYGSIAGRGWTNVAVIATITEYSISEATAFIESSSPEVTIATYQQFLEGINIDIELTQIVQSGARVIYAIVFGDWQSFIEQADEHGLVGDNYVWYVPGSVDGFPFLHPSQETRGAMGNNLYAPESPELESFLDAWYAADPEEYPGAGPAHYPPSTLSYRAYDMIITVAKAIDVLERQGKLDGYISAETWTETVRSLSFTGVSGQVQFRPNGDRIGEFSLDYYSPEADAWIPSAKWSADRGYEVIRDVVWYSNTTDIPDLDIREPFDYWS